MIKSDQRLPDPDPPTDDDILNTIEDKYYGDSSFDASDYVLQKLPEILDLNDIRADRQHLRLQLQVVSKRLSDLILKNQPSYMKELQRVTQLQTDLQEALETCRTSRSHLDQAKRKCTVASLGILSNYRKRQQVVGLLRSLWTIKTLQKTDERLRELLEEEDFPGAIQLCLECQKAASTFRHYKCISELTSKLQDTLEMIEEHLDVALSKVCNNFNTTHYEKLQTAYAQLGKTQTAMDQLHMHFTSAIHNTAFVIVLGYVELCSDGSSNFQKRQYPELCKYITSDNFTPCLVNLCKALWEVMHSYYKIMEWHEKHDVEEQENESGAGVSLEGPFNRRYVRQKLEHGLVRIWQDVQHKVKTYLLASDLSGFKFNEFIHVLDLVNRLIRIGEEFCGSKSEELQESIRRQSINYFRNYHRARLEELRMFLENEGWELCPVKSNFSILQLLEFRFLRNCRMLPTGTIASPPSSPAHSKSDTSLSNTFFQHSQSGFVNPFDIQNDEEESEDILNNDGKKRSRSFEDTESDDSDVPEAVKQEYVDEKTEETPVKRNSKLIKKQGFKSSKGQAPILTNTTLNVIRLFGKYMQMMSVLKPIAFDVVIYMTQLFDYYMFTVHSFFAANNEAYEFVASNRLRSTMKRISENLILDDTDLEHTEGLHADPRSRDKILRPTISSMVDLSGPERLHGLAERVMGAESLVFLGEQFELLQRYLDALIPAAKKTFLHQYYTQTVSMANELRRPIYITVAANAIDYEQVLSLMCSVKWDIGELMSQHSSYVDKLLREMQVFSMRLTEVSNQVPIPREAYNILWEQCIRMTTRTLVEGFSSGKKCSNEGRALMQLDFQQFLIKLEKISELRPIPDKEYVETYVKAYYLPENTLEEWIANHKEYSNKQVIALLNCVSHINRRTKQRLINIILEESRR